MLRSFDRLVLVPGALPLNADGSLHESPPAAFGPFRVLHQVGAGSLGPVFRAHDAAEGRLVAIKAFRLDITPEHAGELAAALELLVNDQPRHPAIVAALAAGVEGSVPYLAQEYVAGEALDAVLRQFGPPPVAETLTTLGRVAEALDRAAGDGIHHGTLHPRDILLGEGGEARVVDLGVAQTLERCGLRVPVRRPYSAPERVDGHGWGGPADIFSLGAIAYELLTGKRLAGPGRPAVAAPTLSHVAADEIAEALERALSIDPAERYPSAADLVDALAPPLKMVRRTPPAPLTKGTAAAAAPMLPLDRSTGEEALEADAGPAAPLPEAAAVVVPAVAASRQDDDFPLVAREIAPPGRFVDVHEREADPAAAAAEMTFGPAAAPDPADLHFNRAAEHDPAETKFGQPMGTARTEHAHSDLDSATGAWSSVLTTPAPPLERRPFLPILVALLVGLSAGFGWGYWTAWRSPTRQAVAQVPAGQPPEAQSADATPPAARDTAVTVDDPEVIGERHLPSPAAAPQRSSRTPGTPPQRAAAPGAGAAAPPARAAAPRTRPAAPAARPAASPSGTLTVRSTPPGASVRVDGRVRGRTPLVLRGMPMGPMSVTVEQPGFKADQRRVALSAAQPEVSVNTRLERVGQAAAATAQGVLVVDSRPAGARVLMDGREIGVTPLSLPGVSPGTHSIRLELAGFNPWVTTADVTAGSRTRVAASLEQRGTPE